MSAYRMIARHVETWGCVRCVAFLASFVAIMLATGSSPSYAEQISAHPQQYVSPDTTDTARLSIIQPDHDWESVLPGVPVDIAVDASANIGSVTYTIRDILFPDDPLRTTVLDSTRPPGFSTAYSYQFPVVWTYNGEGSFEITAVGTTISYPVEVPSSGTSVQSLAARSVQTFSGTGSRQVTASKRKLRRKSGRPYRLGTGLVPIHPYDTDGNDCVGMPGAISYQQLKGAMHVHWYDDLHKNDMTDSLLPADVAAKYRDRNYNFIAMTEHDHITPPRGHAGSTEELERSIQPGYNPDYPRPCRYVLDKDLVWIENCEEWTPDQKHILAIGINGVLSDNSNGPVDKRNWSRSRDPLPRPWALVGWDQPPFVDPTETDKQFDFTHALGVVPAHGNEINGGWLVTSTFETRLAAAKTITDMNGLAFLPHPGFCDPLARGTDKNSVRGEELGVMLRNGATFEAVAIKTHAIELLQKTSAEKYWEAVLQRCWLVAGTQRLIGSYMEEDYTPGVPFARDLGHTWISLDIKKPTNWASEASFGNTGRSAAIMNALASGRWWSYCYAYGNVNPPAYPKMGIDVNTRDKVIEVMSTVNWLNISVCWEDEAGPHETGFYLTRNDSVTPPGIFRYQYDFSYASLPGIRWAYVKATSERYRIFSNPIRFVPREKLGGPTVPHVCETTSPELVVSYADEYPGVQPEMGLIGPVYDVSSLTSDCPPGAVLTLPSDLRDVSALGIDNLRLFHYDGSNWSAIAGSTVNSADGTVTANITALGKYVVSAVAVEDIEPPKIWLLSPEEGAAVTGDCGIKASATDNVGVSSVSFRLTDATGNKTWHIGYDDTAQDGGWGVSTDLSHYPSGSYTIEAEASDIAANTALASRTINLQTSATLPQIMIGNPHLDLTAGVIVAEGTVSDECSVEIEHDGKSLGAVAVDPGSTPNAWKCEFPCGSYGPGQHTLVVTAADTYGNENSATLSGESTALELSAACLTTSPNSPRLAGTTVKLTGTVAGGSNETNLQYEFSVSADSGSSWSTLAHVEGDPANMRTWVPSSSGSYILKVVVHDGAITKERTGQL